MEKEISIAQGLALTPYSDVSPDGQLAVSHNVEVYNGSLRPSVIQGTEFTLPGELLYIHATQNYTHYLYYDDEKNVKYAIVTDNEVSETGDVVSVEHVSNISSISHIGNVLTFLQPGKELYYVLWGGESYKDLGNIPDLDISFGLTCDEIAIEGTMHSNDNEDETLSPSSPIVINDDEVDLDATKAKEKENYAVFCALLSKMEDKYCNCTDGGFIYPFYVRAAWRLYDNTHIKLTAPVLMQPNMQGWCGMSFEWTEDDLGVNVDNVYKAFQFVAKLYYNVNKVNKEWNDIIKGIDIFVSIGQNCYQLEPDDDRFALRNYGSKKGEKIMIGCQNHGTYKEVTENLNVDLGRDEVSPTGFRGKFNFDIDSWYEEGRCSDSYFSNQNGDGKNDPWRPYVKYDSDTDTYYFTTIKEGDEQFLLLGNEYGVISHKTLSPCYKDDEFIKGLGECAEFFKLKEIDIDDIKEGIDTTVNLKKGDYNSIKTNDILEDESTSHTKLSPTFSFSYNGRLHVFNTNGNLMAGFGVECLATPDENLDVNPYKIIFKLQDTLGTTRYIKTGESYNSNFFKTLNYVFTPNTNAVSFIVEHNDKYDEISLTNHPLLNGKYYFNDDYRVIEGDDTPRLYGRKFNFSKDVNYTLTEANVIYTEKNAIYTSDINNPFLFPLIGQNTVGNGEIKSLSTITKALSEGQYGSFPLMAFCTDGNYSLGMVTEGDNAGIINSVNAMQPDVCINPDSVTQIEEGILFVSGRGVMMASANQIDCISQQLDGVPDSLAAQLMQEDTNRLETSDTTSSFELTNARTFFENVAGVIWDYINQRAIFVAPGYDVGYVMTKGTQGVTWSTIGLPKYVQKIINVYPYSYVQWADNSVTILDDDYNFDTGSTAKTGLVLTRPLKLDTLQLKKLDSMVLQGIFEGAQKITVYGSNDAKTWTKIGSTTRKEVPHIVGRYYKYWRIALDLSLTEAESVSGLRLQCTPRPEGRLR